MCVSYLSGAVPAVASFLLLAAGLAPESVSCSAPEALGESPLVSLRGYALGSALASGLDSPTDSVPESLQERPLGYLSGCRRASPSESALVGPLVSAPVVLPVRYLHFRIA